MKRRTKLVIVALVSVLPILAFAQGLVPCTGAVGDECQVCMLSQLISNVIGWLVMILSIVTAIIFMVAGLKLVTSGGNPAAKAAAKKMITNAFIGFVIVLACWLIVDLIMKMLLGGGNGEIGIGSEPGPWNAIQCTAQPVAGSNPTEYQQLSVIDSRWGENQNVGAIGGGAISTCDVVGETGFGDPIYDCTEQRRQCGSIPGGVASEIAGGSQIRCLQPSGANPPDLSAAGTCESDLVSQYFPDQVGNAQCIIRGESVCGARMISTSDVMRSDGNRAFSFGPMQINLTFHELVGCGPNGTTLNCPAAFSGTNYSARVVDEALYAQCAAAAQDVTCGLANGRRIQQRDGWSPWSTAGGCGL